MAIFKIKEVENIPTAFIYLVEADTKEEAISKYINELAGSLELEDSYTDDSPEGVTVIT